MADAADVELAEALERVRQVSQGCCMDDAWRGRRCQYHEGFLDGLLDALVPRD